MDDDKPTEIILPPIEQRPESPASIIRRKAKENNISSFLAIQWVNGVQASAIIRMGLKFDKSF